VIRSRRAPLLSCLGFAAVSCPDFAWAQDAEVTVEPDAAASGRIVYDQAYFAEYQVQNAQDMLRRVPGVDAILSDLGENSQERGFGSGGDQILLNGRRFPGKSNDLSKTLARLRAHSIARIELIRGASSDIDVQSTGVVVNIVLAEGASLGGGGTFELALRGNDEGSLGVDGLVSYAGSTGNLGFNIGLERNLWGPDSENGERWTNRIREEVRRYPDGVVESLRPQLWDREHDKRTVTAGLTYDFAGGARAQLNGFYETVDIVEVNRTDVTRFDRLGVEVDSVVEQHTQSDGLIRTLELGGEFTTALWGGGLTVLLLGNSQKQPTLDDRIRIVEGELREVSRTTTVAERTEYIARTEYRLSLSDEISLNVGGEGSYNKLQQDLVTAVDLNDDGTVEPVTIPTGDARVKELRGEAFGELRWAPSTIASLSASLNFEASDLTSNSPFNPGRKLSFWKPRIDARYNLSSAGQLRLLAEKQVSQLDFDNFVPSYDVLDDRIEAGNPGLLPEQVLNFELGYEHRLPNDVGVLEGMVFYQDISDAIDYVPLQQGSVLVSAQGNLGDAWMYGAEITASLRLVPLGLRDAILTVSGELNESSVTDPFTGEPRRLRDDEVYEFSIGYRHDVSAINFSYGFDYENRGADSIESELFSRDLVRDGPLLSLFAEQRLTQSLTLRGDVQNLLGSNQYRTREIFAINQIDGVVRRLDGYRETRDVRYAIALKGTF